MAQLDTVWPTAALPGEADAAGGAELQAAALQRVAVCGAGIPRSQKGTWVSQRGERQWVEAWLSIAVRFQVRGWFPSA